MVQITKEYAEKIAEKLGATDETKPGDEHDEKVIYFEGRFVARYGIRRGSKKNSGHDHVQKNLNVNMHFAKELATCTKSRLEYFEKIGVIRPVLSDGAAPQLSVSAPTPRPWEKDWVAIQASENQESKGNESDDPDSDPDPSGESSI
jgi:hypothetical protein